MARGVARARAGVVGSVVRVAAVADVADDAVRVPLAMVMEVAAGAAAAVAVAAEPELAVVARVSAEEVGPTA